MLYPPQVWVIPSRPRFDSSTLILCEQNLMTLHSVLIGIRQKAKVGQAIWAEKILFKNYLDILEKVIPLEFVLILWSLKIYVFNLNCHKTFLEIFPFWSFMQFCCCYTDFAKTEMLGIGVEWTGTVSRKCMSKFNFAGHIK